MDSTFSTETEKSLSPSNHQINKLQQKSTNLIHIYKLYTLKFPTNLYFSASKFRVAQEALDPIYRKHMVASLPETSPRDSSSFSEFENDPVFKTIQKIKKRYILKKLINDLLKVLLTSVLWKI